MFGSGLLVVSLVLAIALPIGAMLLRGGIAIYNRLASKSSAVPEPDFGKAVLVMLVLMIANFVASFSVGMTMGQLMPPRDEEQLRDLQRLAQLVSLPITLLVMSGLLAAMLPTTFLRGFLVAICYALLAIVIAVPFVIIGALLAP